MGISSDIRRCLGGSSGEHVAGLVLSSDEAKVYVLLSTSSTDMATLQYGSGFIDDNSSVVGNDRDCYIAMFDRASTPITPLWLTYFSHRIYHAGGMAADNQGGIHITGTLYPIQTPLEASCSGTTNTHPVCNQVGGASYFQSQYSNGSFGYYEIFYARFDANSNLVQSTLYGSARSEEAIDIAFSASQQRVYIVGSTQATAASTSCAPTSDGSLALCPYSGGYFQTVSNVKMGLIVAFDLQGALVWATTFGSANANSAIHTVGTDFFGQLYVAGFTDANSYASNTCAPPVGAGFPKCFSGSQFNVDPPLNYGAFASAFTSSPPQLNWSTFLYEAPSSIQPDEGNSMTFAMYTMFGSAMSNALPTQPRPNFYFQPLHADLAAPISEWDSYIITLSETKQLQYASYFGGFGADRAIQALPWVGGRMYLVGVSRSLANFPFHCPPTFNPYCYMSYATQTIAGGDALYAQIQYDVTIGVEQTSTINNFQVYPNPSSGELTVRLPEGEAVNDITCIDALGRRIETWKYPSGSQGVISLLLPAVAAGVYCLEVSTSFNGYKHLRRAKFIIR